MEGKNSSPDARQSDTDHSRAHGVVPTIDLFRREERFYGVNPIVVLDDLAAAVKAYVSDGFDALERQLLSTKGLQNRGEHVKQAVDKAMAKFHGILSRNMDKFELYALEHVLRIPEGVSLELEEDEDVDMLPAGERDDSESLQQELNALRAEMHSTNAANLAMRRELLTLEAELQACHERELPSHPGHLFAPNEPALPAQLGAVIQQAKELSGERAALEQVAASMNLSPAPAAGSRPRSELPGAAGTAGAAAAQSSVRQPELAAKTTGSSGPDSSPDVTDRFQRHQADVPVSTQSAAQFLQSGKQP